MKWSVLSNGAFLIPAILAWGTPLSVACILLTVGSAWYHWQPDRYWSHHADEFGMYLTFSLFPLMACDLVSWPLTLLLAGASHLAALRYGSGQILPVLGAMTVGCMLNMGMYWQILSAIAVFGVAYWVRGEDHEVDSTRHGHWHVLSAGLIGMLWWFLA